MEDLSALGANLTRHADGYWVAPGGETVSFPEDGHDACYSLEDDSFWFRHRNDVIAEVVRRFPPGGTIFDIGGGNGYVAAGLEQAGFPVVLVEPGAAGVRHALERGLTDVVRSTFDAAGFRPRTLPAVGLFDVLEHVEDDDAFLGAVRSAMKPNGRAYLTVPAYQALWSLDDVEAGHHRRYSTKSLSGRLEGAGFDVEYATHFFWFLPMPVLLLRTIPTRLGARRSVTDSRTRWEHSTLGGVMRPLIDRASAAETRRIQRGGAVPFGGSCLVVARA